jgi:hypothetical protein
LNHAMYIWQLVKLEGETCFNFHSKFNFLLQSFHNFIIFFLAVYCKEFKLMYPKSTQRLSWRSGNDFLILKTHFFLFAFERKYSQF